MRDTLVIGIVVPEVLTPDDISQGTPIIEPADGASKAISYGLRSPKAVLWAEISLLVSARQVVARLPSVRMSP